MSSGPYQGSYPYSSAETGKKGYMSEGQSVLDGRIVLSEYRPSGLPPYAS